MGWYMIAEPGTEAGPCAEPCGHNDCAATRAQAAAPCLICGKPIGYATKIYFTSEGAKHALCAWKAAEAAKED